MVQPISSKDVHITMERMQIIFIIYSIGFLEIIAPFIET